MLRVTSRQAELRTRSAITTLADTGAKSGDRIAICVPADTGVAAVNADIICAAWAAVRCGITPVMINPALPPRARADLLADSESVVVIADTDQLRDLFSATGTAQTTAAASLDTGGFAARPMHYTSGTTGVAKGVWTGFLTPEDLGRWWDDEHALWDFTATDSTLVHGPLSSSAPLRHAILVLAAGGDVLIPDKFDPTVIARGLAEDKPSSAFTVPSHWQRLFALPELPPSPYRFVAHAGSACPPDIKRALHAWAGAERTWEFYGSTEGQFTSCRGDEWEAHPGTLGRARTGRRLFIDSGVIWCETPDYSAFEYWRDPAKTEAAWRTTPTGTRAFTVGDLGRLDNGYLYLDGRREDLIITGGMNVYPNHVESVLSGLPGVDECAVFGVADDTWGQRVCVALVGSTSDEALLHASRELLAGYQIPKSIYRCDELPRNAMGKVLRLRLPDVLGAGQVGTEQKGTRQKG